MHVKHAFKTQSNYFLLLCCDKTILHQHFLHTVFNLHHDLFIIRLDYFSQSKLCGIDETLCETGKSLSSL